MIAYDIVSNLCRNGRPEYLMAFRDGGDEISSAGITTDARLVEFLAQVLHETDGLTIAVENMNYSASRIREVWPSRPSAVKFAYDPQGLANSVYANRMGNGGPETGDGFKYRGRGILQTTGRSAYRSYGKRCGVDFEGNPDLVLTAEHALKPALSEWVDGGCNALADSGNTRLITKRINGGYTGLDNRVRWKRNVANAIIQARLNERGYGPLRIDGNAGPATVAAVKRFQSEHGLTSDGIVGKATFNALQGDYK